MISLRGNKTHEEKYSIRRSGGKRSLATRRERAWPTPEILVVVAILVTVRSASAQEADLGAARLLERLQTEAVDEWQAMAQELSHCGFDYTVVETDRDRGPPMIRRKQISGRIEGACFLLTETIDETDQVSVYARNDRYEFALVRSGDSPWTITWQSGRPDDETPVGSAYAYLAGMLRLPWSISATPLATLVRHPRFAIGKVRHGGNGLVELSFSIQPASGVNDDLQHLSGGLLVLDTKRRWAIVRYQARYGNQLSSSAQLAYSGSGPPELSQVQFKLQTGRQRSNDFAIDVSKYDWRDEPGTTWTLSAFGLPEFENPTARRRWLRLVNINVGIVFVLIGLILWRCRQKRVGEAD